MQEKKPIIGLTPYHNTEKDEPYMRPAYLKAIRNVGGIPVILPLEADHEDLRYLAGHVDGILFTGGPDVHPFYFGEETQRFCGNVSIKRDSMELSLLKIAMDMKKPVLGICRGVQLLNIGLGGDIYQDINSQFKEDFPIAHTQPFGYDIPSHTVAVAEGTLLAKIAQCETIRVNSMHHQAVRNVAPGLVASGFAPGGLVEAIEMPGYPFLLGVQWHPEYLWEQDEAARRIFEMFVAASHAIL